MLANADQSCGLCKTFESLQLHMPSRPWAGPDQKDDRSCGKNLYRVASCWLGPRTHSGGIAPKVRTRLVLAPRTWCRIRRTCVHRAPVVSELTRSAVVHGVAPWLHRWTGPASHRHRWRSKLVVTNRRPTCSATHVAGRASATPYSSRSPQRRDRYPSVGLRTRV
jgi:hypothetical protein